MHSSRSTEIAAAFSERIRIRLLCLLREKEHCVTELVAATGVPQPTVSRHLAYLLRAGLVCARTEGLHHIYRLAPVDHPLQACLFGCLGACLGGIADAESEAGHGCPASASRLGHEARRTRVNISG